MRKGKYHELKYTIVGDFMTVVKILELVGSSENSWDDAIQEALTEAAKTVKNSAPSHEYIRSSIKKAFK